MKVGGILAGLESRYFREMILLISRREDPSRRNRREWRGNPRWSSE